MHTAKQKRTVLISAKMLSGKKCKILFNNIFYIRGIRVVGRNAVPALIRQVTVPSTGNPSCQALMHMCPSVGCMAERLKTKLLEQEKLVDVLAGPDAYRDLPQLLSLAYGGQRASNVLLSLEKTYADVITSHQTPEGHSACV